MKFFVVGLRSRSTNEGNTASKTDTALKKRYLSAIIFKIMKASQSGSQSKKSNLIWICVSKEKCLLRRSTNEKAHQTLATLSCKMATY